MLFLALLLLFVLKRLLSTTIANAYFFKIMIQPFFCHLDNIISLYTFFIERIAV